MNRPARAWILALALVAACASTPELRPPIPSSGALFPTPFSQAQALEGSPTGWHAYRLLRFKPLTKYSLVRDGDTTVVYAHASSSVSGIQHPVSVDLHDYPVATWRWRVPKLIENADNENPFASDAPARVVFTFEGGRERLPASEQITYDLARAFSGNEMPYATLMYIWEPGRREGDIITHFNSTRVKMIVAANAQRELGRWHAPRVNLLEDFRRAFGEDPPRVKAVGIMSDSDNTGTVTEAYYGDIRFLAK
jgi:hypothetical protein